MATLKPEPQGPASGLAVSEDCLATLEAPPSSKPAALQGQFESASPPSVRSEGGHDRTRGAQARRTLDADSRHTRHNISIAIDPARQLFNGSPVILSSWIDATGLARGAQVLQVGCGLAYYTAVIAHCVGPSGRVVAVEINEALAAGARSNLTFMLCVDARHGGQRATAGESVDGASSSMRG